MSPLKPNSSTTSRPRPDPTPPTRPVSRSCSRSTSDVTLTHVSRMMEGRCLNPRILIRRNPSRAPSPISDAPCVAAAATASHGIRHLPRPPSPLMYLSCMLGHGSAPYRSPPIIPRSDPRSPPRVLHHGPPVRNAPPHSFPRPRHSQQQVPQSIPQSSAVPRATRAGRAG